MNWGCPACSTAIPHFEIFATVWIGLAVAALLFSLVIRAPYGRHARKGWGPAIPDRLGWIIFEGLALVFFNYFFFAVPSSSAASTEGVFLGSLNALHLNGRLPVQYLFAALYNLHYLNRALIFPLRARKKDKQIPLSIVGMAGLFNLGNGYLLGSVLGSSHPSLQAAWAVIPTPLFAVGLLLFVLGFGINLWGDEKLMRLRAPGETGYKIPKGGLFNYISCPNHLGEMIEWIGFALLCWPSSALIFALWTICNVLPRSMAHHQWYKEHFADYPAKRKALIPGIL